MWTWLHTTLVAGPAALRAQMCDPEPPAHRTTHSLRLGGFALSKGLRRTTITYGTLLEPVGTLGHTGAIRIDSDVPHDIRDQAIAFATPHQQRIQAVLAAPLEPEAFRLVGLGENEITYKGITIAQQEAGLTSATIWFDWNVPQAIKKGTMAFLSGRTDRERFERALRLNRARSA